MIFAYQKLLERRGKDTTFVVRGQERTRHDIEHYWTRRHLDPAVFDAAPNTPVGLEYRTPSPALLNSSEKNAADDATSGGPGWLQSGHSINHQHGPTPRASDLRLLRCPEPFRTQDQALHHAQIYCRSFAERLVLRKGLDFWHPDITILDHFRHKALYAMATTEFGLSKVMIKAAQLDLFALIPAVLGHGGSGLMATLLHVITEYSSSAMRTGRNETRLISCNLMKRIATECGQTHPLAIILRACHRPSSSFLALSERLLSVGKDTLTHDLGADHIETRNMIWHECVISANAGNWYVALAAVKELCKINIAKQKVTGDDNDLWHLLNSQYQLIVCQFRVGNYIEANRLVEDGLRASSKFAFPADRNERQADFLYLLGMMKAWRRDLPAAIDLLSQALQLRLGEYGADDLKVAEIAQSLRCVFKQGRQWHSAGDANTSWRSQSLGCRMDAEMKQEPVVEGRQHPVTSLEERLLVWVDNDADVDEEIQINLDRRQTRDRAQSLAFRLQQCTLTPSQQITT